MKATLLMHERHVLDARSFVEIVVWRVPNSVRKSRHNLKYRLAYVVDGVCLLRYDNEAGKGDHRHLKDVEKPYLFTTNEALIDDFWNEVEQIRSSR